MIASSTVSEQKEGGIGPPLTSEAAARAAVANIGTREASAADISLSSKRAAVAIDARARRSHRVARACDGG